MRSTINLAVAILLLAAPAQPGAATTTAFPRPPEIEHQVRFWRNVFTVYSQDQTVIHDTVDLNKIYTVIDFRQYQQLGYSKTETERMRKDITEGEIARIRDLLRRLAEGTPRSALQPDDQRIYDLFKNDPDPYKFLNASDESRVRPQRGIRERFYNGLRTARLYLPEMERIFRDQGLPPELTRLPLIESCFDVSAYSKVGAAGVWQFMPATGRLYMEVSGAVDERRDPIASTRAAAQYLSRSYYRLGNWPLAITSYNHGPNGMSRAIDETGSSDIVTIIRYYGGPSFGFSSRNFYAEFLAALEIEQNAERYFGKMPREALPATRTVMLDRPVDIFAAARLARTQNYVLADLNPALMDPVISGRAAIPAGYGLRLPADGAAGFENRLAEFVAEDRTIREAAPSPPTRVQNEPESRLERPLATHKVQAGQTLSGIAQRYGVSVQAIRVANRMGPRDEVRSGQVLRIPNAS
jgi:membrane-bound lytic murein transglycosylase D